MKYLVSAKVIMRLQTYEDWNKIFDVPIQERKSNWEAEHEGSDAPLPSEEVTAMEHCKQMLVIALCQYGAWAECHN